MQISRQARIKFLGLILSTQLIAACNLPTPQERAGQHGLAASFTVKAAADKSKVLEARVQGAFGFPSEKTYNFQACLKTAGRNEIIAGHEFKVVETNSTVTSDKDGCITWPEKYAYNYLGESVYVQIDRTIEGLGLQKGAQKVSFAINPWSHGENLVPVLNPEDGTNIPGLVTGEEAVSKVLKGFSSRGEKVSRPLWVEDGRLFVTEQKMTQAGVQLLVEMRPNVSVQLTKMNGELLSPPRLLTKGKFKATLQMIHIYQHENQEIRRVLAGSEVLNVEMQNGSLSVKSPLLLPAIPTRGQILVALHLSPEEGPEELKTFEGLYLLGEYDQVKGASILKIHTAAAETPNFKISEYVTSALGQTDILGKDGQIDTDTYQKPKIEVAQLEFRYIRVGEERTTTREIVYSIKACLKHGLDQKTTRSHTFKVTRFKQKDSDTSVTSDIKTDNNSCLNWDEKIRFKVFECQHYIPGFIQISNEDLGMNEKLQVIVNPWESGVGAIARDVRYVDPTQKVVTTCESTSPQSSARPKTQIMIESYAYNALSYNYSIDNLLGLQLQKKFQLRVEPRVLSYSNLSNGRSEFHGLRDGIYLLRVVVVQNRDYTRDRNNYVTSAEKLVNVISGQINTDVTLSTEDLKALGNRNNLLMQILPVDDQKVRVQGSEILPVPGQTLKSIVDASTGLESPVFVGPIILNADDSNRPLRILEPSSLSQYLLSGTGNLTTNNKVSLTDIIEKGQNLLRQTKAKLAQKADKRVFAQENNLQLISLNQMGSRNLQQLLAPRSNLADHLLIQKSELSTFVQSGDLSNSLAQKLCAFWSQDYFNNLVPGKKVLNEPANIFGTDCFAESAKNPAQFFNWEKRLVVKKVGRSVYDRGINQGLTVGSSFNLGYSRSHSFTKSLSVSGKGGLSLKFLSVFSVGLDGGYSLSWSDATSRSSGNSMSVNGNTTLSLQESSHRIQLQEYEQCALVKLNPQLFVKAKSRGWFKKSFDYTNLLNPQISDDQLTSALTRGLMICEGQVRTQPKTVTENYYLISQETFMSQMQDSGDARNRQFFLGLRSSHDFENFLTATKSEIVTPNGDKANEASSETGQPLLNIIQNVAPQTPGMYRVR